MISSWSEYHTRKTEPVPGKPYHLWVPDEELRPQMTGKFRRIHTRVMRKTLQRLRNIDIEDTRRTAYVVRRKYLARRKRKH